MFNTNGKIPREGEKVVNLFLIIISYFIDIRRKSFLVFTLMKRNEKKLED
jgi:hypothetical protein